MKLNIKSIFLDFDGVLSDNKVYTSSSGVEYVCTSKYDSMGLKLFREKLPDIHIEVITSELNDSVAKRCEKLNLPLFKCNLPKIHILQSRIKQLNLSPCECAYVGNDLNDLECMKYVGYSFAVNDSHPTVKNIARFVLTRNGGNGALRELFDQLTEENRYKKLFSEIEFLEPKSLGERSWGEESLLAHIPGKYTFKRLKMNKGSRGGLQYHRFKDECTILISGKIVVRYGMPGANLNKKTLSVGECLHFPPFSIHQEIALEDSVLIEVSNPIFNDRVKAEPLFDESPQGGMVTTSIDEVIFG